MTCAIEAVAGLTGGVGGVAEDVQGAVVVGEQVQADGRLVMLGPGPGGEGDGGV
ncbi:hypothetical protein [Streptomyces sp. GC420]|uniref:hypothetical protein n=1 Tax=Streptomyces sp. GC420 TaxID=2697568 RepID=UPI001414EB12|nr:hypothetical protein [Streptomyces sp. GC420]NBM15605.1 hypothetical protein [Streptomyces sp. GC420]